MKSQKRVEVSVGMTVNLGNFESMRVDVLLDAPVRNTEMFDKSLDRLYKKATEKVTEYCEDLEKKHKSRKPSKRRRRV